jgi:hypothetical protein
MLAKLRRFRILAMGTTKNVKFSFGDKKVKIAMRRWPAFHTQPLYEIGHLMDGSTVFPLMAISDMDEQSRSEQKGTWVSPAVRGYVIRNPVCFLSPICGVLFGRSLRTSTVLCGRTSTTTLGISLTRTEG